MKKIICGLSIILLILIPITVNAIDITVDLVLDTQDISISKENNTFEIILKLGEFINIESTDVLGYTAIIDYDTSIIDYIDVIGQNGWNVEYNSSNNKIVGDTTNAKQNTDITKIIFHVKEDKLNQKTSTKIKLSKIEISDGNLKIETQREVTVNLLNKEQAKKDVQEVHDIKIIEGEKAISTVTATSKLVLPKAGTSEIILITIIILTILMIIFKIKSRKIKY